MTSRVLIVLVLAGWASAQIDVPGQARQVRVRVAFANGVCDTAAHVRLMSATGPIADGVVNDQCEAEFWNIPVGTYRVSVSGQGVADGDAGTIEMASARLAEFEVRIKNGSAGTALKAGSGMQFVSTGELAIPPRAQKQFDKANEFLAKNDFSKAIDRLQQAIAIYPLYAKAYNNLGVVYARTGDREHEREALEKAISIDDHFAPAYVNLGRMNLKAGDFGSAEAAFRQASSYDPTDANALVLLAYSQFMDRHFDDAIATSTRAHALTGPHSSAHHIAARAFEQKHDAARAIAELETFLKEEPTGPEAEAAHKELEAVRAIPH